MPTILAINPNTSPGITAMVADQLRRAINPEIEIKPVTGRFGAAYISSEAGYAIAGHAALDAYAVNAKGIDAVLLACFGDPGLFALREIATVPVVALAEASMREAAKMAPRFSIVTGGRLWPPMLQRLAHALGFGESLASVRTVALTGAQIAASPDTGLELLVNECRKAQRVDGASVIILGGAALTGLAAKVESRLELHVLDSVLVGAKHAEALSRGGPVPYSHVPLGAVTTSTALAPELARMLRD
jgi:Asp/Glu/hydantoin racemase